MWSQSYVDISSTGNTGPSPSDAAWVVASQMTLHRLLINMQVPTWGLYFMKGAPSTNSRRSDK